MKIIGLKTLHMTDPLGIGSNPYFSWRMESPDQNVMQTAYQVVVKHENGTSVWDTGKIQSEKSSFIEYEGNPLISSARYEWTAKVWDNKGNAESASAWFETALLAKSDWKAEWAESTLPSAERKNGFGNQPPATLFRKGFTLKGKVTKARLYATCHGVYRLTINGIRPDDREFAPEYTVYEKQLCYQTYDVTAILQEGANALGMYVGDGWYCCANTKPQTKDFKQVHAVLFQLEVEYADGGRDLILSDENVKTAYGSVLSSDLYAGEKYDANLEMEGWDKPGFDDAEWTKANIAGYGYQNLTAQLGQPVRPIMTLSPSKVYTSPKGEKIVDFGQIIAGRVRMHVKAPKDTEITLDLFEAPDKEGNYYNNIMAMDMSGKASEQKDVFISNGEEHIFEPMFTFHGFRYARVTGLDDVNAKDFTAVALSSEKDNVGTFESSNPLLNRLYENTRWSQRSNMLSIPTDCPQREKAGWTGDIQIYAPTALLNEDVTPFLSRWMTNLSLDQDDNGAIPMIVPYTGIYPALAKAQDEAFGNAGSKGMSGIAGWSDAAVLVPYVMYQMTGNKAILRQQYESMKRWCDYIIHTAKTQRGKNKNIPEEIDQYLWNTGFHFGEWLIPSRVKDGYVSMEQMMALALEESEYIAPIFGWQTISDMADISRILDQQEDEKYYGEIAEKIKDAIQKGVMDQDGNMPVDVMGAYLLPVYFDLVPEKFKKKYADKIIRMIEDNGDCLDTGFLGTPYILDTLCKIGRQDIAYKLLYQDQCPSWLYEVKQGATTIWESWFAFTPDGTPLAMSLNHYAFGCVDDWMFRMITGINKTRPGFKHILIQPEPDSSLSYAKRTFTSEYGDIVSHWERRNGKFILQVVIPCNTTATVVMPNGEKYDVGSGAYSYECSL
jgi:alpha-L-rhamnosidase